MPMKLLALRKHSTIKFLPPLKISNLEAYQWCPLSSYLSGPALLKVSSLSTCTGIIWELVGNADSPAPPSHTYWILNSEKAQPSAFEQALQVILTSLEMSSVHSQASTGLPSLLIVLRSWLLSEKAIVTKWNAFTTHSSYRSFSADLSIASTPPLPILPTLNKALLEDTDTEPGCTHPSLPPSPSKNLKLSGRTTQLPSLLLISLF